MPDISIITATYNSTATLRDCLNSVRDQRLSVEHLIIDGVSKDTTLKVAGSYPHISRIISEPDEGIYDAMNKGINVATGEVIGILNSDDFYADDQVLKRVEEVFKNTSVETCYGNLHYVDAVNTSKVTRNWRAGCFRAGAFYWGWMPPHPTFLSVVPFTRNLASLI